MSENRCTSQLRPWGHVPVPDALRRPMGVDRPDAPDPDRPRRQAFADARTMVEAIIYRYRCGIAWRDLPEVYGPWQTVWTWHRRLAEKGTWDTVLATLTAAADAEGLIDWSVSVDSTIARAHQHATNITRHTGGWIELQESA